jgi:SAM-dependent methyltransferase
MPRADDTYRVLGDRWDGRPGIREHYEKRIATKGRVLDIGGRNRESRSARRLRGLGANPDQIVCTDLLPTYNPDLVDDITATTIEPESFDSIYCDAILEHVTDYEAALENMRKILRPGGEAFIYVPFVYGFHDQMDYHRFTVTEVARMTEGFSESKVFLPGLGGYGWVLAYILSYGQIQRFPRLHRALTNVTNAALAAAMSVVYRFLRRSCTREEFVTWAVAMNFNHGFCAWVRK